jgi:hypothetical protein
MSLCNNGSQIGWRLCAMLDPAIVPPVRHDHHPEKVAHHKSTTLQMMYLQPRAAVF